MPESAPPDHARRVYDDVFQLLPDERNPTPMVRVRLGVPEAFELYAKLEWYNPLGSIKDRAAWEMLRDLEAREQIGPTRPGRGIVEPTSGNTGLSLAALASVRGYAVRAVVPQRVPEEKRTLMRMAGAQVDVVADAMCPLPGTEDGSVGLARGHARSEPDRYVLPNQYENHANARAHERTTGPEIWRQTRGRVTHVFTSLGTCGTVTGLARFLRAQNPGVRVIAVQPTAGHDVPGVRAVAELGVSKLYDPALIDEVIEVPHELAYRRAAELIRRTGLRAGPSSGLIYEGARRVAQRGGTGVGVAIFCDDAFKYLNHMRRHLPDLEGA